MKERKQNVHAPLYLHILIIFPSTATLFLQFPNLACSLLIRSAAAGVLVKYVKKERNGSSVITSETVILLISEFFGFRRTLEEMITTCFDLNCE